MTDALAALLVKSLPAVALLTVTARHLGIEPYPMVPARSAAHDVLA
jgi:hypothetical protein